MLIEKTVGEAGAIGDDASRGRLTAAEIRRRLEDLEFTPEERAALQAELEEALEEEQEQLEIEYLVGQHAELVKLVQSHPANFLAGTPGAVRATVQPVPVSVPSGSKEGLFGRASGSQEQQQTSKALKPSSEASVPSKDRGMIEMEERFAMLRLDVDSIIDYDAAPASSTPGGR